MAVNRSASNIEKLEQARGRLTVRQISNRYLPEEEAITIADLRRRGLSIRRIAAQIRPDTIDDIEGVDETADDGSAGRVVDISNDIVARNVSSIVVMVVGALNSNDGPDFPVVTAVRGAADR
jgi:hypothetical protein